MKSRPNSSSPARGYFLPPWRVISTPARKSPAIARADARLHRRQLWRRGRRLKKTFSLLQRFELLPPGPTPTPQERQALVNNLDAAILSSAWFQAKKNSGLYPEPDHVLPYILRAAALDEKLEPFFLGRALFHLAQRRGFLS